MSPGKREALGRRLFNAVRVQDLLRTDSERVEGWTRVAETIYAQGAADALAEARSALRATLTGKALFDALATIDGLPSADHHV